MNHHLLHTLISSRATRIYRSLFHSHNTWRGQIQTIVPARLKLWPSSRPWCRHLNAEHYMLGFGDTKIRLQHVFRLFFPAGPLFDNLVCCCRIAISIAFFLCSASPGSGSPFSRSWCELTDLSHTCCWPIT